jgi:hypothetical protein
MSFLQNRFAFLIGLFLALVAFQPANAAPPAAGKSASPPSNAQMQAYREARVHLQKLGQRLGKIEEAAVKANPDLQKQQEQFRQLLIKTMKANGYDAQTKMNRLREVQKKLADKSVDKKERQALLGEFRQKSMEMQGAQRKALQNPEVQKSRAQLAKDTIAAMTKQDPDTPKLIDEVKQTRQHLMEMQKQMSPH